MLATPQARWGHAKENRFSPCARSVCTKKRAAHHGADGLQQRAAEAQQGSNLAELNPWRRTVCVSVRSAQLEPRQPAETAWSRRPIDVCEAGWREVESGSF